MPALRRYRKAATALAWLGAVSCNSDVPEPDFHDPANIAAVMSTMLAAAGTPALVAFSATSFPPILAVSPQLVPGDSLSGLIPIAVVGKTFTWNSANHVYESSLRTGAPPDGVRFVLYRQTTSVGGGPVLPLVEIGAVDLRDVGTGTTRRLDVQIRADQVTVADYHVTGTLNGTTLTAQVEGTIDGDKAHNPNADQALVFQMVLNADTAIGFSAIGANIAGSDQTRLLLDYSRTTTLEHTLFTAVAGSTTIEIEMGRGGSGSVTLNDDVVATVDNGVVHASDPTIRPSDVTAFQYMVYAMGQLRLVIGPRLLKPFYMTF